MRTFWLDIDITDANIVQVPMEFPLKIVAII
jgi:hypothetical protein